MKLFPTFRTRRTHPFPRLGQEGLITPLTDAFLPFIGRMPLDEPEFSAQVKVRSLDFSSGYPLGNPLSPLGLHLWADSMRLRSPRRFASPSVESFRRTFSLGNSKATPVFFPETLPRLAGFPLGYSTLPLTHVKPTEFPPRQVRLGRTACGILLIASLVELFRKRVLGKEPKACGREHGVPPKHARPVQSSGRIG